MKPEKYPFRANRSSMFKKSRLTIKIFRVLSWTVILLFVCISSLKAQDLTRRHQRLQNTAEQRLEPLSEYLKPWRHLGRMQMDSLIVQPHNQLVKVYLHPHVAHLPLRDHWIKGFEAHIQQLLGRRFRDWGLEVFVQDRSIIEYIPNALREPHHAPDQNRIRTHAATAPLVKRVEQPVFDAGLAGSHIALWHSHGFYFNQNQDRWQWQRARLFGTVEDIFPMEYVLKYIAPMLENAGANVLMPRERDTQTHEVIVDNDGSSANSLLISQMDVAGWMQREGGFAMQDILEDDDNPFVAGTHMYTHTGSGARLQYIPDIPEDGYYAVCFSWAFHSQALDRVPVEVNYAGGKAAFEVNQQMGWGTWIYLGHFFFKAGRHSEHGSLVVYTPDFPEGVVTADAVRFGGGQGSIARGGAQGALANQLSATDQGQNVQSATMATPADARISGVPRFMEAARYYLQYAGMPDTLVYGLNKGLNDYNDDFMSRGEWVNYLMGAPLGPQAHKSSPGLGIPIDLSFAFHTDAGVTPGDSVIGTLAIYSAQRDNGVFPDGVSRMASRDLSDLIQDQIVADIRALHNPRWTRRALWDRQYSEAWRPNTPALLLELLSHQNLADMQYGLDPRFQFTVSRAIYKGMLRFVAANQQREAIVQPLPPSGMRIESLGGKKIRISWNATPDPLEPSAHADYFKIFMRTEGGGFDQGTIVFDRFSEIELPHYDSLYSFRVTALNQGGESFPSEILAASFNAQSPKADLVVNGFTRISAHPTFDSGSLAGLKWWDGPAIPSGYSYAYTGLQHDYHRSSPWLHDDSPGWGASYADREGQKLVGNTFDNVYLHGLSLRNAGRSFVSTSREAFEKESFDAKVHPFISIIMGRQMGIPSLISSDSIEFRVFTPALQLQLQNYLDAGGNLLLSGAHIATDMMVHNDKQAQEFASQTLGFIWRTGNACNSGKVQRTQPARHVLAHDLAFNTQWHPELYPVEAPDGLEPSSDQARLLYRYASNQIGAAVLGRYRDAKILTLGFPLESISDPAQRDFFVKEIIQLLETNINQQLYD